MTLPSERPLVYLITPGHATDENIENSSRDLIATVRSAVEAGVKLIQLREKRLSAKNLYELALEIAAVTRNSETRLLINDRADIAAAVGADGVHLTSISLRAAIVRKAFGKEMLIGLSAHSKADVEYAAGGGADFAVLGPVFATPDKEHPIGVEKLRSICTSAGSFPVLALGGIDNSNFQSVIGAGAAGFAAIRSLNDPVSMREILSQINS